jgi:radical SAM superfamily enzyme YgiQ (UPF0313 family)
MSRHNRFISLTMAIDEIPLPYLKGFMDPCYPTGYLPLLQIAKGCPFTCTFCNSSLRSNNKVYSHSVENVKIDLDYIVDRVKPEVALSIADANFGMYSDDEEIADYIGYLQKCEIGPNTSAPPRAIASTIESCPY